MTSSDIHRLPPEDDHIVLDEEMEMTKVDLNHHFHPVETRREYVKFGLVILGIILASLAITTLRGWGGNRFANDFMAIFFMTFAAFKFINLEEFAITYRTYDLISQKIRPWPYAFPFIEAFLGLAYFVSTDAWQINILTMIITGTAGYSVYKALTQKSEFHCACLGNFIKLPLTKVSLVENGVMFVMATVMLFL
jgi:hypothetical protein